MSEKNTLPALFSHYPELKNKLAWTPLGSFPTPVQQLKNLGCDNLWVKRDDQTSPVYGGNKVRKLEFLLADAIKKKSKRVITFGAIGTNHGLATSIYSRKLGLDCTLLLFRQPVTKNVKQNLLLFKKYHAKTIYKKTVLKTLISFYLTQKIRHPGAYSIFAGGSNSIGTIGFVNAAFELKSQIEQGLIPEPEIIFCPAGSTGTAAGLLLGTLLAGLNTPIRSVRVTASHFGPLPHCTSASIQKLAENTYHYLKNICKDIPKIKIKPPQVLDDYFGEGYGQVTDKGKNAYRQLKEKENIILDPTYTSKTFAAVLDYCAKPENKGKSILYWHTYNSVDMSEQAKSIDHGHLPKNLQKFIEADEIGF
ncbi:MAG: pyridoxal-phosphate dependent enzyme [Deltaproteobacteria bacterium]|nr:pyridoxal-phosphate dependent enzyme [Deltaproteobacteria bacterium]